MVRIYLSGYGLYNDGTTTFINASICTKNYKPTNRPFKFHMNIPQFVCDTEHAKANSEFIKGCDKKAYGCSDSDMKCTEVWCKKSIKCDKGTEQKCEIWSVQK